MQFDKLGELVLGRESGMVYTTIQRTNGKGFTIYCYINDD
jgi:hypothetical protein